jgi:hypothetical protein
MTFLEDRVNELEARVRESEDVDYEEVAKYLPREPQVRVLALATVLKLDALKAAQEGATLLQLEEDRDRHREAEESLRDSGMLPESTTEEA